MFDTMFERPCRREGDCDRSHGVGCQHNIDFITKPFGTNAVLIAVFKGILPFVGAIYSPVMWQLFTTFGVANVQRFGLTLAWQIRRAERGRVQRDAM